MKSLRVILLNGPARTGKDETARQFIDLVPDTYILSMIAGLHAEALAEYGFSPDAANVFEHIKDEPHNDLDGKTARQVYIEYGNKMRRRNGEDYFAQRWLKTAATLIDKYSYIVVPDCKLWAEYRAAKRLVGEKHVCLVELHRTGRTWQNDVAGLYMGRHINGPLMRIINDGDVSHLGRRLHEIVAQWEVGGLEFMETTTP